MSLLPLQTFNAMEDAMYFQLMNTLPISSLDSTCTLASERRGLAGLAKSINNDALAKSAASVP